MMAEGKDRHLQPREKPTLPGPGNVRKQTSPADDAQLAVLIGNPNKAAEAHPWDCLEENGFQPYICAYDRHIRRQSIKFCATKTFKTGKHLARGREVHT